jgi:hypothetical protein
MNNDRHISDRECLSTKQLLYCLGPVALCKVQFQYVLQHRQQPLTGSNEVSPGTVHYREGAGKKRFEVQLKVEEEEPGAGIGCKGAVG